MDAISNSVPFFYKVRKLVTLAYPRPGPERSLTQIRYSAGGDLLFSVSKDQLINVWYSHNGERSGTYDGRNGTYSLFTV
jgi:hypothetical protein